jgi:glycosyltransferase involved in cell wall biosynthesis
MKYSIIIPYRKRERHLKILLPALINKFKGEEYEVIVSEQDDSDSFRIAALENIGFLHSIGDIIVLQQADYVPHSDVSYEVTDYPILPAQKGIFVNEDMSLRPIRDIPAGYRNWSNKIDDSFYGGVIAMKRSHFETINGLNPLIKAWGNEDPDLGLRFKFANIPVHRNLVGTFTVLYHEDNNPELKPQSQDYIDFIEGRQLLSKSYEYKNIGYKNLKYDVEKFQFELDGCKNAIWLKSKNYKIDLHG